MPPAAVVAGFRPPATRRLAGRFFWKECRRLGGIALGVAGMALVAMYGLISFVHPEARPALAMVTAFGGGAMLAVAAAVTLFSVEKEEGTVELLRILPWNPRAVVIGKLAAALAVILATTVVLALVARLVAGRWPSGHEAAALFSQGPLMMLEAFVWGLVASLVCPNPLVAAVLGIAAASMSSQVAMALTLPNALGFTLSDFQAATPGRLGLVALGAAIAVWLATRWPGSVVSGVPRTKRLRATAFIERSSPFSKRRWLSTFWRLAWQSARQSWVTALAVVVLGLFLSVGIGVFLSASTAVMGRTNFNSRGADLLIGILGLLMTPALLGAVVFREDQRRGVYRFLSEHAGRPRTLWLARQATWLAPLVLFGGIACVVAWRLGLWFYFDGYLRDGWWYWDHAAVYDVASAIGARVEAGQVYGIALDATSLFWCAVLSAFAYGQFFSLAVRSDILAGMLAIVLSIPLMAWSVIVAFWGLPPLAFVAPLGAGAMLASFLRVRDWMFDCGGVIRWAAPAVALVAPIGLVAGMTPMVRMDQVTRPYALVVSSRDGDVPLEDLVAKAEQELARGREVADAYERLLSRVSSNTVGMSLNSTLENEQLDEFIELSRVECRLSQYSPNPASKVLQLHAMNGAAQYGFRVLRDEGLEPRRFAKMDLDEWLERLLACRRVAAQQENGSGLHALTDPVYLSDALLEWAAADGQTAERLLRAVRELEAIDEGRVGPAERLVNDYLLTRAIVRGEEPPSFFRRNNTPPRFDEWLAFLTHGLPGERERAERALAILATFSADYLGSAANSIEATGDSAAAARQHLVFSYYGLRMPQVLAATDRHHRAVANDPSLQEGQRWPTLDEKAALARDAGTSFLAAKEFVDPQVLDQFLLDWITAVAWRRAERVRLALIAYRIDRGEYPKSLDDLAPDFLQTWQCRDPFADATFGYAPEGFEVEVGGTSRNHYPYDSPEVAAAPGTPLIWCVGIAEATPTPSRIRIDEDGESVEVVDEADDETGDVETRIFLKPQRIHWNSGEFWMPLPK